MGTGFEISASNEETVGIIPRAVRQLFKGISNRQEEARESGLPLPEFKVSAQFLELYNEDIIDLFDNATCSVSKSTNGPIGGLGKRSTSAGNGGIRIHEDANGNIYTVRLFFYNILYVLAENERFFSGFDISWRKQKSILCPYFQISSTFPNSSIISWRSYAIGMELN